MTDTTNTPWPSGPLWAFGEPQTPHDPFMYTVRETKPKRMVTGYPTPTARYRNRNRADAQLGALAPDMASAIIDVADEFQRYDECGSTYDAIIDLADKLRKIGPSNG